MLTRLINNGVEVGQVGVENDPRYPRVGAIIDSPKGEPLAVVRIMEAGSVAIVEPFQF